MHEYFVGKGIEDLGLLMLRRIGLGGVCGTSEGVVFFWAPVARLEGCGEGVGGEGEDGEEDCEMHHGWTVGWWVMMGGRSVGRE